MLTFANICTSYQQIAIDNTIDILYTIYMDKESAQKEIKRLEDLLMFRQIELEEDPNKYRRRIKRKSMRELEEQINKLKQIQ